VYNKVGAVDIAVVGGGGRNEMRKIVVLGVQMNWSSGTTDVTVFDPRFRRSNGRGVSTQP